MMAPPTSPPRLGNILSQDSKEHNVTLTPAAQALLGLIRQEFSSQIEQGQQPRFYTVLHWCKDALEEPYSISQLQRARRDLVRGGYITLNRGRWSEANWAGGVVQPGPRLVEEIRELAAGRDGGGK